MELNSFKTYLSLCQWYSQNEIMFPTQPGWNGHCLWKPWPGIVSQWWCHDMLWQLCDWSFVNWHWRFNNWNWQCWNDFEVHICYAAWSWVVSLVASLVMLRIGKTWVEKSALVWFFRLWTLDLFWLPCRKQECQCHCQWLLVTSLLTMSMSLSMTNHCQVNVK